MVQQRVFVPGATVYGAGGEKVGTLQNSGENYIVVEKGFFFPSDYFIPITAVTESREDAVYLSVTKDDALNQGWDQQPAGYMTSDQPVSGSARSADTQTAGVVDQDVTTVPVYEEHLQASTRMADVGDVTISKHVVTEQETIQVPVTEERVRVEWRAPSGEVTADGEVFEEGAIEIPVSREVIDVSKRTVQTGELEVTKEKEQRTQKVTDSVRREVVDVEDTTGDGQAIDR